MDFKQQIVKIDDNTYSIEDDFVRCFLLLGSDKALLIDSGVAMPNAKEICQTITDLPVELLNTHADGDHISGNDSFDFAYLGAKERDNYVAHGKTCRMVDVNEGDIIDLGQRKLEIIDLGGHTAGSIGIYDIDTGVLYSGDTVQNSTIYMFSERRNMENYIKSLKKLESMGDKFKKIYPSHGTIPVYPDLIGKLIEGATSIQKGNAAGKDMELFGNKVKLYELGFAGFYCDP